VNCEQNINLKTPNPYSFWKCVNYVQDCHQSVTVPVHKLNSMFLVKEDPWTKMCFLLVPVGAQNQDIMFRFGTSWTYKLISNLKWLQCDCHSYKVFFKMWQILCGRILLIFIQWWNISSELWFTVHIQVWRIEFPELNIKFKGQCMLSVKTLVLTTEYPLVQNFTGCYSGHSWILTL
jgi:hypothetical protein